MTATVIDLASRRPVPAACCDAHLLAGLEQRLREAAAENEGHLLVAAKNVDQLLLDVAHELESLRSRWTQRQEKR